MGKEDKEKEAEEQEEEHYCEACKDTGYIEIMGGSSGFEWDVIDVVPCECQKDY